MPPTLRSIYYRVVPHSLRARVKNRTSPLGRPPAADTGVVPGGSFGAALAEAFAVPPGSETHPMYQTWLDYALGTNDRGSDVVRRVSRYTTIAGRRHLDIGSAHGGTVVAFAGSGARSVGVEIDPKVLDLGRANVVDHPHLDIQLVEGDILDPSVRADLGRFDIITGEHVIEHVASVSSFLEVVADLLTDDGICHMLIPNPKCPKEIASDGHYGLFGLTLLERPLAERYFRLVGNTGDYGVGEYSFDLHEHHDMFRDAGLDLEHTNPPERGRMGSEVAALVDRVADLPEALASRIDAGAIPVELRGDLDSALGRYLSDFNSNHQRYVRSTGELRKVLARQLLTRYAQEAWYVVGYKRLV